MNVKLFLGSNTPIGFVSNYENRLSQIDRIYILKGTAGCGKSSLMRRVGREAERRGLRVEYWHCSSDPDSLDGVYVPARDFAFVDGTAPHVIEPTMPVVKERVLALADFSRGEVVAKERYRLAELMRDKKLCFSRCYGKLKCAFSQIAYAQDCALPFFDERILRDIVQKEKQYLASQTATPSTPTRQFCTAVTPDGTVRFSEPFVGKTMVRLDCVCPLQRKRFLKLLCNDIDCAAYADTLDPNEAEAIVIGDIAYCGFDFDNVCETRVLDLNSAMRCPADIVKKISAALALANADVASAVQELKTARALHKRIEDIYIADMDFSALTEFTDKLLDDLFG